MPISPKLTHQIIVADAASHILRHILTVKKCPNSKESPNDCKLDIHVHQCRESNSGHLHARHGHDRGAEIISVESPAVVFIESNKVHEMQCQFQEEQVHNKHDSHPYQLPLWYFLLWTVQVGDECIIRANRTSNVRWQIEYVHQIVQQIVVVLKRS